MEASHVEEKDMNRPLRIGVLGAANIAPMALISPALLLKDSVQVRAIAARDPNRARSFAKRHSIPVVHSTYEEVVADSEIDLVYIPLPNGHHKEWAIRALKAGKHVLSEKPVGNNREEVEEMYAVAREQDKLLVEAFHWRFHPLAKRMKEILDSGDLGRIKSAQASLCVPILNGKDIRYNFELGGGATMDTGCYTINCVRLLVGDTVPPDYNPEDGALMDMDVASAEPVTCYPQVDQSMKAKLVFSPRGGEDEKDKGHEGESEDGKVEATIECSLYQFIPSAFAAVVGEKGEMRINNYIMPHLWHKLTTTIYETPEQAEERKNRTGGSKWWMISDRGPKHKVTEEKVGSIFDLSNTTYYYQLQAFANAVRVGLTANSSPEEVLKVLPFYPEYDSLRNAEAIDKVYQAAGLKRRGGASVE